MNEKNGPHMTVTLIPASSCGGSQSAISITPAALASFVVSGLSSPRTAGASGAFTVTAKDAYGNTATAYTGTVHFTSTDGIATLPGNYTFTGELVGRAGGVRSLDRDRRHQGEKHLGGSRAWSVAGHGSLRRCAGARRCTAAALAPVKEQVSVRLTPYPLFSVP